MSRTACLVLVLRTAASAARADAPQRGLAGLDEVYPKLDARYIDLHKNPDLSMKEEKPRRGWPSSSRPSGTR